MMLRHREMASRLVIAAALAAGCRGTHEPTPRERVLAAISSSVGLVITAHGSVLASARVRPVIDALRPRWPANLGCAIDAALTADDAALGVATDGTTLAIATHARPVCPVLSRIGPDLYVATLGVGHVATANASVLDDPAFARVRRYLVTAPLAATAESPALGARFLATATVDPLEAWVAIDPVGTGAIPLDQRVEALVERMRHTEATAAIGTHASVRRDGAQTVVELKGIDADLAPAVRELARWIDGSSWPHDPAATSSDFPDREIRVKSPAALLADAVLQPVVANGGVTGLRLASDVAALDLHRGDQIIALDDRPVASAEALLEGMKQRAPKLCVRRGTAIATLRITTAVD